MRHTRLLHFLEFLAALFRRWRFRFLRGCRHWRLFNYVAEGSACAKPRSGLAGSLLILHVLHHEILQVVYFRFRGCFLRLALSCFCSGFRSVCRSCRRFQTRFWSGFQCGFLSHFLSGFSSRFSADFRSWFSCVFKRCVLLVDANLALAILYGLNLALTLIFLNAFGFLRFLHELPLDYALFDFDGLFSLLGLDAFLAELFVFADALFKMHSAEDRQVGHLVFAAEPLHH